MRPARPVSGARGGSGTSLFGIADTGQESTGPGAAT